MAISRLVFLSVFFFANLNISSAQLKATTPMGIEVLLYEDGTWKVANDDAPKAKRKAKTKQIENLPLFSCSFKKNIPIENKNLPDLILNMENPSGNKISILTIKSIDVKMPLNAQQPIKINFEDGSTISFNSDSNFTDDFYTMYYGTGHRNIKELEPLRTKRIKSIDLNFKGRLQKEIFSKEQSDMFLASFNCK